MERSERRGREGAGGTAGGCHTSYLQDRPLLQDRAPGEGCVFQGGGGCSLITIFLLLIQSDPARYFIFTFLFYLTVFQPQRSEAREPVTRRKEQHQDSRLRHGLPSGRRQSAGNELRVCEPCVLRLFFLWFNVVTKKRDAVM